MREFLEQHNKARLEHLAMRAEKRKWRWLAPLHLFGVVIIMSAIFVMMLALDNFIVGGIYG